MAVPSDSGRGFLWLPSLPHEILLNIFEALRDGDDFHQAMFRLRLTCKALSRPATDVLFGQQHLRIEFLEEQTRMLHHCHTLRVPLPVMAQPPLDPKGMVGSPLTRALVRFS